MSLVKKKFLFITEAVIMLMLGVCLVYAVTSGEPVLYAFCSIGAILVGEAFHRPAMSSRHKEQ